LGRREPSIGLGWLSRLEPPQPPSRYERERARELLHIDVKKLGSTGSKGAGGSLARARVHRSKR
jgi:hypothetical protein